MFASPICTWFEPVFDGTFAPNPIPILLLPVVTKFKACCPIPTFVWPVVTPLSASLPTATFCELVALYKALLPIAILSFPVG